MTSKHFFHRSPGIPTTFPLQTNTMKVDGQPQNTRRALRNFNAGQGKFPAEVWNINNAARNLVEIIANEARSDNGDYRIRIYTIGMGELVRYDLGTRPEKSEDILKRDRQRRDVARLQPAISSKESITSRRRRPTSRRPSRRCRTRSSA